MNHITKKGLARLCINRVISVTDYWKIKKLRRLKIERLYTRKLFKLQNFEPRECILKFRFTHNEIIRLRKAMKLPKIIKLRNRIKFTGIEGLCILLRRLSYPNRLSDLVSTFSRDSGSISRIFNWTLSYIYTNFAHVITSLNQHWLSKRNLETFAEACAEAGSLFPNIVGFMDGTARPICRPSSYQKDYYSGYKKQHVLKYQSVVFPNGLIGRLDGPFKGKRHDSGILHLSLILQEIKQQFVNSDGTWFALYGDQGYSNQKFIKVGFKKHNNLTPTQRIFNASMSALRISVEYGFGKILQHFAFVDFKKNQKLLLQPLKKYYIVAGILTNAHTCLNGSQVTKYFNVNPPTLEEYLK